MAEAEAEEHEGQEEEGGDPAAVLEAYCARLEGTAAWGGHVELTALAAALQRHIKVRSAPVALLQESCTAAVCSSFSQHYCCTAAVNGPWTDSIVILVWMRGKTTSATLLLHPRQVYAVGMPTVSLGKEHEPAGAPPLQLCYLRHAFGLGEHYNSTKPLRCVRFSGLEDEQQEEDEQ
jgi:OTU-like cysteine protease